ncbi:AraC family transcriptional regulator [Paenibacillus mesophilus]|uniref:AraC family transcriptional regulator n=1 Tax=Paenibacillus mesophilus TaxID=2582849 RepID=UPI00130534E7|nr:AraC family transcriptional regulator [Paenibacillus mesophilus]
MHHTFTRLHMNFKFNLYFMVYKTWEHKYPDEYYHSHEGMEFLYIHEGDGRLILNDRLYLLKPRTLVYFQPHQVHLVRFELPRLRSIVKINLSLLKQYLPLFPHLTGFLTLLEKNSTGQQIFQLSPKQDSELTGQLGMIHSTLSTVPVHEQKEQFIIFWMQFMAYLKAHVFAEFVSEQQNFNQRQSHHVEKIVAWIEQHYKEPFCLENLSADIHLSDSYMSNLFRSYMGSTITEFIMRRRLDEARRLLATTSMSVDQVGKQSGFPNPAYFSRCFKKRHSVTPQQFRSAATVHRDTRLSGKALFE